MNLKESKGRKTLDASKLIELNETNRPPTNIAKTNSKELDLKFKKSLGRKTKIKLKKSRSNDKRNMPNKLNQQANSYSKTNFKTIQNIDESFMSFECLDNINDSIPQESLNIPEIQNAKANDPFIENNKLP